MADHVPYAGMVAELSSSEGDVERRCGGASGAAVRRFGSNVVGVVSIAWWLCAPAALAVPLLLVPSGVQAVQQVGGCGVPEFPAPVLCARAGLDTVPSSYLVMVDESGSMSALWPAVQGVLAEFAAAVPDGDQVDVRLFAGGVRAVVPAGVSTGAARSAGVARFRGLERPRGAHTDLGRAAEAVVSRLRAEPVSRPQFVFFLTDGRHEPPPDSPYRGTEACLGLAESAVNVTVTRPVSVAVVRLTAEADASFLTCVFPDAVVTDAPGPAALRQWFAARTREAAVEKLRALVLDELRRPAGVLESAEPVPVRAGRTARRRLRLRGERRVVAGVVAESTRLSFPDGGALQLEEGLSLEAVAAADGTHRGGPEGGEAPGATVTLPLSGRSCAIWRPPGTCAQRVSGVWPVPVRLEPAEELRRIDLPQTRIDSIRVELTLAGGGLLSWPLYVPAAAFVLAAVGGSVVVLRWRLHRAYLPGRVIVREGGQDARTVRFGGRRMREYAVTVGGREVLRLEARSERGRTAVYALPGGSEVRVRGRRLSAAERLRGPRVFEGDDVEIRFLES